VKRLPADFKGSPHRVNQLHLKHPIRFWMESPRATFVYFVHSYYAEPVEPHHILATTDYGLGVHRHCPAEGILVPLNSIRKEPTVGLRILRNFRSHVNGKIFAGSAAILAALAAQAGVSEFGHFSQM